MLPSRAGKVPPKPKQYTVIGNIFHSTKDKHFLHCLKTLLEHLAINAPTPPKAMKENSAKPKDRDRSDKHTDDED
ncbi:unnamed protein product [Malus baccata var. baccata]